jgi:hypothetical protein
VLLILDDELDACAYFLDALDMPVLNSLTLEPGWHVKKPTTEVAQHVLEQAVARTIRRGLFEPLSTLHITLDHKSYMEDSVLCWTASVPGRQAASCSAINTSFLSHKSIFSVFQLDQLRHIQVVSDDQEDWSCFSELATLSSVHSFTLFGGMTVINFLETFASEDQATWRTTPWPGLLLWRIENFEPQPPFPSNELIVRMVKFLSARREKGWPLPALELRDNEEMIEELKRRLPEITFLNPEPCVI